MTQMLTVTANAVLSVPDGWRLHPDYPGRLLAPDGRQFSFWVSGELRPLDEESDDPEKCEFASLTDNALMDHGLVIEHGGSILNLAPDLSPTEIPDAALVTDPHAVDFSPRLGEETAYQVYERTEDERLRTVL